jgi:hypothetical protein
MIIMASATLKDVMNYFKKDGETTKDFTEQWKQLSDKDKDDLKKGLGDGTLNY